MSETRTLDWTYELPPAGDGASGLEDYLVEDSQGGHVGKVATVLRHDDRLFVAVECGTPPLDNELVPVPWDEVREVDHETLRVRLELSHAEVGRAPRLNQERKVEHGDANAVRVTDIPGPAVAPSPVGARGPIDRPSYVTAVATGLLGVFSALVLVIFATGTDFGWEFALFAIPVALLAFAGIQAYRVFRNPYEPA